MAHETPLADDPTTDLPDPEDEPANTPDADAGSAAPPVLNRAERRAQAKGKSGTSAPRPGGSAPGSSPRGGSGGTGSAVPVRFPRTGNK